MAWQAGVGRGRGFRPTVIRSNSRLRPVGVDDEADDPKGPLPAVRSRSVLLGMPAAVAASTSASAIPSTACITAICAAEILSLLGYSIVPALLPQIMDGWSLSSTEGGWLAGIISGGYMLGVVPLVANRPDAGPLGLCRMCRDERCRIVRPCLQRFVCSGAILSGTDRPRARRHVYARIARSDRRYRWTAPGPRRSVYTSSFTIGTAPLLSVRPRRRHLGLACRLSCCGACQRRGARTRLVDASAIGDQAEARESLLPVARGNAKHKVVLTKREIQADQLPARLFAKVQRLMLSPLPGPRLTLVQLHPRHSMPRYHNAHKSLTQKVVAGGQRPLWVR
jgi:hypothetical protein